MGEYVTNPCGLVMGYELQVEDLSDKTIPEGGYSLVQKIKVEGTKIPARSA